MAQVTNTKSELSKRKDHTEPEDALMPRKMMESVGFGMVKKEISALTTQVIEKNTESIKRRRSCMRK